MIDPANTDPVITVKKPQIGLQAYILASKRKTQLVRDRSGRLVVMSAVVAA
jgi:hypothetical protein